MFCTQVNRGIDYDVPSGRKASLMCERRTTAYATTLIQPSATDCPREPGWRECTSPITLWLAMCALPYAFYRSERRVVRFRVNLIELVAWPSGPKSFISEKPKILPGVWKVVPKEYLGFVKKLLETLKVTWGRQKRSDDWTRTADGSGVRSYAPNWEDVNKRTRW